MKKSLVLAMAAALGLTASAYAANPFSDVPAGHWAYDAVAKLTDAGVVDGYGATFGGDKLMTRYEMAQLVAKAMAKGANCDKLAAEFATELDGLGVKVAALEKKFDNVKITGNIRYSYRDAKGNFIPHPTYNKSQHNNGYNRLRSRFWVNGRVNDNWTYTGMLEQNRFFHIESTNDIQLMRAWVNGRIGGVKVEAGRCYFLQMSMIDGEGDGVKAEYTVDGVKLHAWALKNQAVLHHGAGAGFDPLEDNDRLYMFKAEKSFGNLDAYLAYWKVDCDDSTGIFDVCVGGPVAKDLRLTAEYFNGDGDLSDNSGASDKNGYEVKLAYKGAKATVPGSWGVHAVYSDRPYSTLMSQSTFAGYAKEPVGLTTSGDGFQGWEVGANYVFAKNITGGFKYFDYQTRENKQGHARTMWSEVVFIF